MATARASSTNDEIPRTWPLDPDLLGCATRHREPDGNGEMTGRMHEGIGLAIYGAVVIGSLDNLREVRREAVQA